MPTNVNTIIGKLSPAQRKKVDARAAQLIAEEMTLRKLRQARKLTQARMGKTLGITAGWSCRTNPAGIVADLLNVGSVTRCRAVNF